MSDKVKQEYVDKLGEEFGAVFHGLWNDWAWGVMRTQEFRVLFNNAEDVELLNAISGGGFLWDIQHILWDDLILRVTRLTDPSHTGHKNNLTVRMLARTYVELLRNIPPVVIIFIFFFFLSEQLIAALNIEAWARGIARQDNSGIWTFLFGDMRRFPSMISGVIVLALFESAFVGEIVRAGIESIGRGQREAARSLGLHRLDELRFVVLPQATRRVLPPLANQFIILVKDSSIISLISVQELTYKTLELVTSTRAIFEAWLTTAALYFALCLSLSLLFRYLERAGAE